MYICGACAPEQSIDTLQGGPKAQAVVSAPPLGTSISRRWSKRQYELERSARAKQYVQCPKKRGVSWSHSGLQQSTGYKRHSRDDIADELAVAPSHVPEDCIGTRVSAPSVIDVRATRRRSAHPTNHQAKCKMPPSTPRRRPTQPARNQNLQTSHSPSKSSPPNTAPNRKAQRDYMAIRTI
jgi:hypothetical protein